MKELKTFDGFLNADDEPNAVKLNEYVRLVNMRFATTDDGTTSRLESVRSNAELPNSALANSGINTCTGAVADDATGSIVFFVHNSIFAHRIFLYHRPTQTFWTVLAGSDLAFSRDTYVHSDIIGGILYWANNDNEPRRINLSAAIAFNHSGGSPFPIDWAYTTLSDTKEYSLIRRPPALTVSLTKATDSAYVNNFIQNESFQFCLQYLYYDGEASVLSPLSRASKLNAAGETFNKMVLTVNTGEKVPDCAQVLRLVVRKTANGKETYNVVHEWDKKTVLGAAQIAAHQGGQSLTFDYYGDVNGETIAPATAARYFEAIPLKSGAQEAAENRLFLADNTEGYKNPPPTTLALTTSTVSGGMTGLTKPLIAVNIKRVRVATNFPITYAGFAYSAWVVYLTEILPVGYYAVTSTQQTNTSEPFSIPGLPTAPSTVALTGLRFLGPTVQDVVNSVSTPAYNSATGNNGTPTTQFTQTANNCAITGISTTTYNSFKSFSLYQACVQFYDRAMRPVGGGVTTDGLKIAIPARNFAFTNGIGAINWSFPTTTPATEIPPEAAYYTVGLSKNLRTRYFTQHYNGTENKYAILDSNGDYSYPSSTFGQNVVGIAFNVDSLLRNAMGYQYEDGDMALLVDNAGNNYTLAVLGRDPKGRVIIAPKDLGDLSTKQWIIELYRPYHPADHEPFYEMGEIYPVNSPGTAGRTYSATFGSFAPDAFCLTRNFGATTYFAEAMCPNDKYYQRWDSDHGRLLLSVDSKPVRKVTSLKFSNVFVPGTHTNGLSNFETLNEEILPLEMGILRRLQITSKAQSEGSVMLAIGEKETASVYLGQTQVTNADTTSYFIKSNGVIGQINVLKGGYGTRHPESVVEHRGNVFWYDAASGCFVGYSQNGTDDMVAGAFKLSRFAKGFSDKYNSLTNEDFLSLGSRPFIPAGADGFHGEILFSLPKLGNPPKGSLVDYPSVPYPYDMLDYAAKTAVFKRGASRWQGEYSFAAEMMVSLGSELYAFKGGKIYKQNVAGSYCNFFGVQYKAQVMFAAGEGNQIKRYTTLQVEASQAPEWTHFRSEVPYPQSSELQASDYLLREGVYTAAILRDRLSPNATGNYDQKLFSGEAMRNKAMLVMLQFNPTTTLCWLRLVQVGYNPSKIQ